MKIVLAPNAFKECLSAPAVAEAMKEGVLQVCPDATIVSIPLADGGDGTAEALVVAQHGIWQSTIVHDPLGRKIEARFGLIQDGKTAVIEMAQASGLWLLQEHEKNPLNTSTFGTGELILAALNHGVKTILIGIGGSATNDGGIGMAAALGYKFYNQSGKLLDPIGGSLNEISQIDTQNVDQRLFNTNILVASDVTNPLTGPEGAAAVYAPQKGATPDRVKEMDAGLSNLAELWKLQFNKDVSNLKGAGAAGGLGAGLYVFADAEICPGFDLVAKYAGFDEALVDADLVMTGEGKIDASSAYGKVPVGVAQRAHKSSVPVLVLTGTIEGDPTPLHQFGIDSVFSIVPGPISLEMAMVNAGTYITQTTHQVIRLWQKKN